MADSNEQAFVNDDKIEGSDDIDHANGEAVESSSVASSLGDVETSSVGSASVSCNSRVNVDFLNEGRVTERLTNILVDEGDGDLLLEQSDRETRVLQWMQVLDVQILGACRADERLRPLLQLNVSSGVAEDRLMAHLSQHFEASEVAMLARCLFVPLVSIRVGKIIKQGTLLHPTSARGNLNLTLLPTSDLRITFSGDDGYTERLSTLSRSVLCSAVAIEEISADNSGRSFLIRIPDGQVFYFWSAEKSKFLGVELLAKMKDLLSKRPSLAELTGISESRLDCFAIHLRAYLVGSAVLNPQSNLAGSLSSSLGVSLGRSSSGPNNEFSLSSKPLRSRPNNGQLVKVNSLGPRSNSFKEAGIGLARNSSSLRTGGIRERPKPHGDSHLYVANPAVSSSSLISNSSNTKNSEKENHPEVSGICLSVPSSNGKTGAPSSQSSVLPQASSLSIDSSLFSPYYCWCPPRVSALHYKVEPSQVPISSMESLSLPPLSSLLPATSGSPMNFPAFLPFSMPSSQQIPTFTPLMCDPIVHIPIIDVCSSGQGYLVSAGPTLSTTIPPLHPTKLGNPLIPETDSMVEKGARETLRLLLSSSQTSNPQLIDVLTSSSDKQSVVVAGSRGLYSGTRDIDVVPSNIPAVSFASLPGKNTLREWGSSKNVILDNQPEESGGSGPSCSDDEGSF